MDASDDMPPPIRTTAAAVLQACFRALANPALEDTNLAERWRTALGLPPEVAIYWSLDQALKLLDRVQRDLDELPTDFEETRRHGREVVDNFRAALQPQMLNARWSQLTAYVSEERLVRIGMLAEMLKLQNPEGRPADGIIPDLLARLGKVREALEGAPFPALAKRAIEERLSALEWAVANWHLIGAHGVSDLMGQMGASIRLAARMVPAGEEEGAVNVKNAALSAMDWIGRCMVVRDVGGLALALGKGLPGVGLLGVW